MTQLASHEQALSEQIESMLVERNLRGMKGLQTQLSAGYCLRAAKVMRDIKGTIFIGTGFPVEDTFETDGPVGALILYRALENFGRKSGSGLWHTYGNRFSTRLSNLCDQYR